MSKTAKNAKTVSAIDVRTFMKAWGGAQGEGRATAFRNDPSDETIQALLDAAENNLRKLMKGGKIATKKSAKTKVAKATAKPKKVAKVKATRKPKVAKADTAKVKAEIKKVSAKIVSLKEKRAETESATRRKNLLLKIRELRDTKKELRGKLAA